MRADDGETAPACEIPGAITTVHQYELPLVREEVWSLISQVFDRAAVLTAFEQVGGADRALEMARDYALERMAFGRPIGSFQAIKHMLANMYVSAALARSTSSTSSSISVDRIPRIDPEIRSFRVSARVSIPAIPITPFCFLWWAKSVCTLCI